MADLPCSVKSVSLSVTLDAALDEHLFETALGIPGVLAVLVDKRASAVRILTTTTEAAEIARSALRPWAYT